MSNLRKSIDGIMQQHEELLERIGGLQEFLEQPRPEPDSPPGAQWGEELSQRLGEVRELLVVHFREEETAGTMQELAFQHPRASRELGRMFRQHRRLLDELRNLLGSAKVYAQGKQPQLPHLRHGVGRLLEALHTHEEEESHLIQELYSQDLGTASSGG